MQLKGRRNSKPCALSLKELGRDNVSLRSRVDDLEAYQRCDSVILSGDNIPLSKFGENTSQIICDAVKQNLNLFLQHSKISSAYRLGRPPGVQKPDNRRILVKFYQRDDRKQLLSACRSVKPTGFYANENLTSARASVLYSLRRLKRKFPGKILSCGSDEGRVYVWMKPPNENARNLRIFVNDYVKFDEICFKDLNVQPNEFKSDILPQ